MAGQRRQLPATGSPCSAARAPAAGLRATDTSKGGGRSQFGGVQPLRLGGHRAMHGVQRRARAVRNHSGLLGRDDTNVLLPLLLRYRPRSPVAVWLLPCHACQGAGPAAEQHGRKPSLVRRARSSSHGAPPEQVPGDRGRGCCRCNEPHVCQGERPRPHAATRKVLDRAAYANAAS